MKTVTLHLAAAASSSSTEICTGVGLSSGGSVSGRRGADVAAARRASPVICRRSAAADVAWRSLAIKAGIKSAAGVARWWDLPPRGSRHVVLTLAMNRPRMRRGGSPRTPLSPPPPPRLTPIDPENRPWFWDEEDEEEEEQERRGARGGGYFQDPQVARGGREEEEEDVYSNRFWREPDDDDYSIGGGGRDPSRSASSSSTMMGSGLVGIGAGKEGARVTRKGWINGLIAGAFVIGIGAGITIDSVLNADAKTVASREVIDRQTPNPDICLANGMSAMVLDQRLFISFNPFNVYVTQAEVKPGCVLRQANWSVLESRGLLSGKEAQNCKKNMNTFGFVGDLRQAPEISCVYHSESAENLFLKDPAKAALGDGFQPRDFDDN
ncbi:hypothetical protein CBR_g38941 [Chara braunii]|uniref:DUF3172 domain-containing protein n=1 Tax=Chara braunii TaxID=69332 RepID=A0A388K0N8_CHABU|nr:hypothetical protein CBR_g38941 [Chara braunii]|eukprot:GBG63630.1 hypothetical protein CBR_g38941 [Chara braunii]